MPCLTLPVQPCRLLRDAGIAQGIRCIQGIQPFIGMCQTMITDVYPVDKQPRARAQLGASQAMRQKSRGSCHVLASFVCRPSATSWETTCLVGGMREQVLVPRIFAQQLHHYFPWPLLRHACRKRTEMSRTAKLQGSQDLCLHPRKLRLPEVGRRVLTPHCC